MKKLVASVLSCALLLGSAGCGVPAPTVEKTTEPTQVIETTEVTEVDALEVLKGKLQNLVETKKFKGIVSVTLEGEPLLEYANGTTDTGEALTIDSPMYIGSVSKQFCAAAILMLRDQGKLSLDDTLDKYFPEYALGKDITVKHLLTMRSGIRNCTDAIAANETIEGLQVDHTAEENLDAMVRWVCTQELEFETDSKYKYSNTNYVLLSRIVEQVSGQCYNDFIRQNILEPVGMKHSGFVDEVRLSPAWAQGLNYDSFQAYMDAPGFVQGAGDLVCPAADLELWMDALASGKVVSQDSFREMCVNYSPDAAPGYGYGLTVYSDDHINHTGHIGSYITNQDHYLNAKLTFVLFSNETYTNAGEVVLAVSTILSNSGLTTHPGA